MVTNVSRLLALQWLLCLRARDGARPGFLVCVNTLARGLTTQVRVLSPTTDDRAQRYCQEGGR